jgi:hypothetical protein
MCYGEEGDGMGGKFIDDLIMTDVQGEFPFMVADEGFACPWIFLKGFDLVDDPYQKAICL